MGLYSHSVGHLVDYGGTEEGGWWWGKGGEDTLVIVVVNMIYALLEICWEKCCGLKKIPVVHDNVKGKKLALKDNRETNDLRTETY